VGFRWGSWTGLQQRAFNAPTDIVGCSSGLQHFMASYPTEHLTWLHSRSPIRNPHRSDAAHVVSYVGSYIPTHYPRAGHSDNAGLMMAWEYLNERWVHCARRLMMTRKYFAVINNSVLALTTFSRGLWRSSQSYRKIFEKLVDPDDLEIIKKSSFLRFWVIPRGVEKTLIFTPPDT
jgi:hypothetical protein